MVASGTAMIERAPTRIPRSCVARRIWSHHRYFRLPYCGVWSIAQTPAGGALKEELNAPGDFLPLACRRAVLLSIEANREAVR